AKELGFKKVIGDLILDPIHSPSLVESIVAYYEFRKRDPDLPLLMGVANVVELIDADSVGMNALLAGIASELGIGILLTTEVSDKTKSSVSELVTATKMMYLAKKRSSVPKDLSFNLLRLKEKRIVEEPYKTLEKNVVMARRAVRFKVDERGYFKIWVDREQQEIAAAHFGPGKREPEVTVKGKRAEDVVSTIVDMGLVSRLDHAAYLGIELQKAELALKTGRGYVQDRPLFE
ncbi:MAG: DUF4346 domain-containing protein, partial [Nitrososphaerota archaeon]